MDAVSALVTVPPTPPLASSATVPEAVAATAAAAAINRPTSANSIHHVNQSTNNSLHSGTGSSLCASTAAASSIGSHNSNSSSCSSGSSSSSNSSGYGSTTTTPTNNYEFQQQQTTPTTTPVPTTPIAIAEPIIPVATVAAVTPFYNESIATHNLEQQQHAHHILQQQHFQHQHQHQLLPQSHVPANTHQHQSQYLARQQQYHSSFVDYQQSPPTHNLGGATSTPPVPAYNMGVAAGHYEITPPSASPYAAGTQYKSSSLTALNYERSGVGIRTTPYGQTQQQTHETQSKSLGQQQFTGTLSSTKQRSSSLIGSSSSVSTSKPQAAATPFYAQPLAQTHANPTTPFYDNVKHKMPLEYHNSFGNVSPAAAAATYHQQQKYYAAAKSQLKEAAYGTPPVGLSSKTLYPNTGNFYPTTASTYDKYLYPPHASATGYSASNHVGSETQSEQSNYRKPAVAANSINSSSWPWGIDYATGNSRTIPPPPPPTANHLPTATVAPTHATYLTPNPSALARDPPYYMGPDKYGLKYEKYTAVPAYQQTYVNPAPSRHHMWSSNAAGNNLAPLNDRHPMATGPTVPPTHGLHTSAYFGGNSATAALNSRQSCCNQASYQPQNCYYPPTHPPVSRLPHNQTASVASTGGYLPPNQQPLGQSPHLSALTASCKYGGVMPDYGNVTKLKTTNDLYINSHHYDNNPPPHNYGYGSAHSNQSLYASNTHQSMAHGPAPGSILTHDTLAPNATSYTNDLNLMTSNFENYHSHFDAHLNSQTLAGGIHNSQQQIQPLSQPHPQPQPPPPTYAPTAAKRALLDYRKPIQPTQPSPTINEEYNPTLSMSRDHHYNQHDLLNTPETTTSFNEYETQPDNSSYTITAQQVLGGEAETDKVAHEGNKNLSLRDFIANWNDDEDEYQNNEELNFDQSTVIQEVLEAAPNEEEATVARQQVTATVEGTEIVKSSCTSLETKEDNQAAALNEAEQDVSQYANLPDIIIDIEKSNNVNSSTSTETHTPENENNTSLNLSNFDVEKELDELKLKKLIPQELTKDTMNDLKDLTKSVNTPQLSPCKSLATQLSFEDLNLESNNKTVLNAATVKADLPTEHYFKDMEGYESGNSRHSNESAFEKEYETFINKITNESSSANKSVSDKCKEAEQQEVEFEQNVQDFSKFYKRKRKLKEDELKSSMALTDKQKKKKLKPNSVTKVNNSNFPQVYTKKSRKRLVKRKQIPQKRKPFSMYYKIIHSIRRHDLRRLKRARDYLTELKEKHLPLIKRQSIKNYSHCLNDNIIKPPTLKSLCISAVNTEEFRQRIMIPIEEAVQKENSSCLDAEDKRICPDPTCETCEVIRSLMEAECLETPLLQQTNEVGSEEGCQEKITVIDEELNIVDLNLKKDEYIVISTDDENLQYGEGNLMTGSDDLIKTSDNSSVILDVEETLSELELARHTELEACNLSTDGKTSLDSSSNNLKFTDTVDSIDHSENTITVTNTLEESNQYDEKIPTEDTSKAHLKLSVSKDDTVKSALNIIESQVKETLKSDEAESEDSDSSESDSESSSRSSSSSSSSSSTSSSEDEASENESRVTSVKNFKDTSISSIEDLKNENENPELVKEVEEEKSTALCETQDAKNSECEVKNIKETMCITENCKETFSESCSESTSNQTLDDVTEKKANTLNPKNLAELMDDDSKLALNKCYGKSSIRTLDSETSISEYESEDENTVQNFKISLKDNATFHTEKDNTIVISDDESECTNDSDEELQFEASEEHNEVHNPEPIDDDDSKGFGSEQSINRNEHQVNSPNEKLSPVFQQSLHEDVSSNISEDFSTQTKVSKDIELKSNMDINVTLPSANVEDSADSLDSDISADANNKIETFRNLSNSIENTEKLKEERKPIDTNETYETSSEDSRSSIETNENCADEYLFSDLEKTCCSEKENQESQNSLPKDYFGNLKSNSEFYSKAPVDITEDSLSGSERAFETNLEKTKDLITEENQTSKIEAFEEDAVKASKDERLENLEDRRFEKKSHLELLPNIDPQTETQPTVCDVISENINKNNCSETPREHLNAEQQETMATTTEKLLQVSSTDNCPEHSAQNYLMADISNAASSANFDLMESLNIIKETGKSNAESLQSIETFTNSSPLANRGDSDSTEFVPQIITSSSTEKPECAYENSGFLEDNFKIEAKSVENIPKSVENFHTMYETQVTHSGINSVIEYNSLTDEELLRSQKCQNLEPPKEQPAVNEIYSRSSTEKSEGTGEAIPKQSDLVDEEKCNDMISSQKSINDNLEDEICSKEDQQLELTITAKESAAKLVAEDENIEISKISIVKNLLSNSEISFPVSEESDSQSSKISVNDHKLVTEVTKIEKPLANLESSDLKTLEKGYKLVGEELIIEKPVTDLESSSLEVKNAQEYNPSSNLVTSECHLDSDSIVLEANFSKTLERNTLEQKIVEKECAALNPSEVIITGESESNFSREFEPDILEENNVQNECASSEVTVTDHSESYFSKKLESNSFEENHVQNECSALNTSEVTLTNELEPDVLEENNFQNEYAALNTSEVTVNDDSESNFSIELERSILEEKPVQNECSALNTSEVTITGESKSNFSREFEPNDLEEKTVQNECAAMNSPEVTVNDVSESNLSKELQPDVLEEKIVEKECVALNTSEVAVTCESESNFSRELEPNVFEEKSVQNECAALNTSEVTLTDDSESNFSKELESNFFEENNAQNQCAVVNTSKVTVTNELVPDVLEENNFQNEYAALNTTEVTLTDDSEYNFSRQLEPDVLEENNVQNQYAALNTSEVTVTAKSESNISRELEPNVFEEKTVQNACAALHTSQDTVTDDSEFNFSKEPEPNILEDKIIENECAALSTSKVTVTDESTGTFQTSTCLAKDTENLQEVTVENEPTVVLSTNTSELNSEDSSQGLYPVADADISHQMCIEELKTDSETIEIQMQTVGNSKQIIQTKTEAKAESDINENNSMLIQNEETNCSSNDLKIDAQEMDIETKISQTTIAKPDDIENITVKIRKENTDCATEPSEEGVIIPGTTNEMETIQDKTIAHTALVCPELIEEDTETFKQPQASVDKISIENGAYEDSESNLEEVEEGQTSVEECEELQAPSQQLDSILCSKENSESISMHVEVASPITKSSEHSNDLQPEHSKTSLTITNNEKESSTEDLSGDFYGFKNQSSFEDESEDFHGFEDLEEVARIRQEIEQLTEDSTANDGFHSYAGLNKGLHKTSTNSLSAGSTGSEINELEALEKELSQHQAHMSVAEEEEDGNEIETETKVLYTARDAKVSTNDIEHIKQMLESDEEHQQEESAKETSKVKFAEDKEDISKDIIKPVKSIIPKLSDLCRAALNSSLNSNCKIIDDTGITPLTSVRELSVEEALAEMYRQAGVLLSDPEDCDNETTTVGHEEGQDVLLINLQEILNSDNNDVYVLQCDMNENLLDVMPTNEADVANEDNQNPAAIDNTSSSHTERVNTLQFIGILDTQNTEPQIHIISSDSESEVIILSDDDEFDFTFRPFMAPHERVAIPFINDNDHNNDNSRDSLSDISTIHHEEIVPDNLNKFLQEEFYKYLHEKYVQRNISKYYHANRVMKKYKKRLVKTKRH